LFDALERRASGERQVKVVAGDDVRREIFEVTALELGQRHRRVDVVEGRDPTRMAVDIFADLDALRDIGSDNDRIRSPYASVPMIELIERMIIFKLAIVRLGHVAVLTVPGHVTLQEHDVVPAPGERLEQGAVCGRMAIAPGGGQTEPEHD